MRKRLWFLCISLWLTSTLLPFEAGADIEPPTWGEAIQNNSFLNIQVEGSSVTVRQRVEMKLKKLLNDDYLYTFGTISRNGQFNENSLSIFTPASGLKDSIFDHGCRLEYLSQVALEETLEIAFGYEYRYPHQDVGEIVYWRSKGTYQYAEIIDNIECVDITCNQVIEVKERMYSRSEWSTVGKGIHVVYHPSRSQKTSILKIVISTAEKVDTLVEQTLFEVTPEHREQVPNLIKNEFITIEFKDALNGTYDYHLSGTIELDLKTATLFDPFYAWFPNEHTDAFVQMAGKYELSNGDTSFWYDRVDTLEVKPSVFGGQNGFYILIPQLTDSSHWLTVRSCRKATLSIEIDGIHSANSSDFVLVTAPQELSFVEFKIPERFYFRSCFSPFEHEADYCEDGFNVRMFYGECPTTGIAHVEWSTWPFPEESFSFSQNYPNPFNQETVIRYSLPRDGAVKLSVYNLLGQQVRTLVDEPQSADGYEVTWDGKNEQGQEVASGVYFFRIDIGELIDRRKMVILR